MMERTQTSGLSGTWAHSYEEDEGGVQVYRPYDTFPFPSRRQGRATLGMNHFRLGDARVIEVLESGPDVLKVRPG